MSLVPDHERRPPARKDELGLAGLTVPVKFLQPGDQVPAPNVVQLHAVRPEVTEQFDMAVTNALPGGSELLGGPSV
jgi:hypothetical protein